MQQPIRSRKPVAVARAARLEPVVTAFAVSAALIFFASLILRALL